MYVLYLLSTKPLLENIVSADCANRNPTTERMLVCQHSRKPETITAFVLFMAPNVIVHIQQNRVKTYQRSVLGHEGLAHTHTAHRLHEICHKPYVSHASDISDYCVIFCFINTAKLNEAWIWCLCIWRYCTIWRSANSLVEN